jgi:hypothetical protein
MAKEIIIKTQKGWDALPESFDEFTIVKIESRNDFRLVIIKTPEHSVVTARGHSVVEAWGHSVVEARGHSVVAARGHSVVAAWGHSVVAAREHSVVTAREHSVVTAWEHSVVTAREHSVVTAYATVCVHLLSDASSVLLFAFAVCIQLAKGKITKKSKTATVIKPQLKKGAGAWLELHGITSATKVTLYKRVSVDFKTQEGTENETLWEIGTTVVHPSWNPKENECGAGKFHACATPYLCDDFRDKKNDTYVAIEVAKKDLYAWPGDPSFPHKIAFRAGTVLFECDKYGNQKQELKKAV